MPSSTGDAHHVNVSGHNAGSPGYETRDVNTRAVLVFLAVLFVVLVVALFVTWLVFRYYSVAEQPPVPASPFADVRELPSGPELEVHARQNLLNAYAKQQQELENYAWEDRNAGIVRIPIERAMDLLIEKGLPVLPAGAGNDAASGSSAPKSGKSAESAPSVSGGEGARGKGQ